MQNNMEQLSSREIQNRRFGRLMSLLIHLALFLLLLLPLLTYPDPPPGAEGILVNLGLPDEGAGVENAPPEIAEEQAPAPEPTPRVEEQVVQQPAPKPEPVVQPNIITTEDPNAIALKKQEEERKANEAKAAREKAAAEEAARKAAEEKARKEAEETKKMTEGIASALGSGKGNTGKPGNQGDPNGDPDASKLSGISTGSGSVGGGLGNRGVMASPRVTDNSQKQGTVVVRVCVDQTGKVIEAEFTQGGSTSADPTLKRIAVENARQWRFSAGQVEKQCGTITYKFVVQ